MEKQMDNEKEIATMWIFFGSKAQLFEIFAPADVKQGET